MLGLVIAKGVAQLAGVGEAEAKAGKNVLVLGSGGLVGRTLVKWLEERNYTVLHVRNRRHIDLRVPGALDVFNNSKVSYAFFLACEVGGSKFIENSARSLQTGIIESNVKMYQVVLPWLAAHKVPFTFTSSYLQVLFLSGGAHPYVRVHACLRVAPRALAHNSTSSLTCTRAYISGYGKSLRGDQEAG
jgi:nucleoside-diphosphate-sugar epimerase